MERTVLCGQLTTGRRLTQLPVLDAPWAVKLNEAGTISATLKLDDPRVRARPELLLALEPARSFLAVMDGDTIHEAGPIWSHAYDDTSKTLTVRAAGMGSMFDHRVVMKVLAAGQNPALSELTFTGALADIARDLVRQALTHVSGALPIVIGADEGGAATRTYPGHEVATVRTRLEQLTAVLGGPDIAFRPRLTADRQGVEWVMLTGTTDDPLLHQPGSDSASGAADWIWDARAPRSGIRSLDVVRDAGGLTTRVWATGQGTGKSMLMAMVDDDELTSRGWPLLEATTTHQSVEVPETLDMHATTDLLSNLRPWTTWGLSVRADRSPFLGSYRAGDWATVWVPPEHLYLSSFLSSGFYRGRIVGFSGSMKPAVKLDFVPTMEIR